MRVLAIDPGSNFGVAVFEDGKLKYAADHDGTQIGSRIERLQHFFNMEPDVVVIEDVVKGSCTMKCWQAVWHTVGVQYLANAMAEQSFTKMVTVGQLSLKKYLMDGLIEPTLKITHRKNKKTGKVITYERKTIEKGQVVAYVNEKYGLSLLQKHHNIADAVCLGEMYLENVYETT